MITTKSDSLIASILNSSVYCRLGKLPSLVSFLRTPEVDKFLLYVKSRYIRWYNEKRVKISLDSFSPIEYRVSLGLSP